MTLTAQTCEHERDGQRDFDFLFGKWDVRNRRLTERLMQSTAWEEFASTCTVRPVWGGRANVDEFDGMTPSGRLLGMTVRLYDQESRQWRLYWANAANAVVEPPVIGRFTNGRGEFYGYDQLRGRTIYVRYTWLAKSRDACRWEQAFSPDDGVTWETNWIMEFTRTE